MPARSLLNEPLAQQQLQSRIPARMAYVWSDGTPEWVSIMDFEQRFPSALEAVMAG